MDYPEELIRYQQGMGRLSGGGLYRLSVDGGEGCAAAEYTDGESVLFKELLLSPDKMGRGLAALERVLPGARCYVRTPALWDGMKGSYLQPFGMIKWYSAEKRALWGRAPTAIWAWASTERGPWRARTSVRARLFAIYAEKRFKRWELHARPKLHKKGE